VFDVFEHCYICPPDFRKAQLGLLLTFNDTLEERQEHGSGATKARHAPKKGLCRRQGIFCWLSAPLEKRRTTASVANKKTSH
jgi:hypothetical protein